MAKEKASHGEDHSKDGFSTVRKQEVPGYVVLEGEPGKRIESPEEFAGYALRDPLGCEIGKVHKLFANSRGEPEYVMVRVGVFLHKTFLIPVQYVSLDEERKVLLLQ